jgi:proteasome alpha subunit
MSAFAKPGAYDYNATVFSPDGRLYQVEYAMEVVNRGGTILGIKCQDGVVLGSEENAEPLETAEHSWKIFPIDDHVAAAIVGLGSDARVLIDRARVSAQSNKLTYDESIDVEVVTKNGSDFQQVYTQHGGGRPFGTALIIGGVDKTGARVFATHPSGTYRAYKAVALGAGRETVQAMLTENYRDTLTLEDSIKLAVKCLKNSLVARELPIKIKIAVIPTATKKMKALSDAEVDALVKEVS